MGSLAYMVTRRFRHGTVLVLGGLVGMYAWKVYTGVNKVRKNKGTVDDGLVIGALTFITNGTSK